MQPKSSNRYSTVGRPPKYEPLPTSFELAYPMPLEEVMHRINYWKGLYVCGFIPDFLGEIMGIQVKKPEIITFVNDSFNQQGVAFTCYAEDDEYLWVQPVVVDPNVSRLVPEPKPTPNVTQATQSLRSEQTKPIQSPTQTLESQDIYKKPAHVQTEKPKKALDPRPYDDDGIPIVHLLSPGLWQMGDETIQTMGRRPDRFRRGYDPRKDFDADEFRGSEHTFDIEDEQIWIDRYTSEPCTIPASSIFVSLNRFQPEPGDMKLAPDRSKVVRYVDPSDNDEPFDYSTPPQPTDHSHSDHDTAPDEVFDPEDQYEGVAAYASRHDLDSADPLDQDESGGVNPTVRDILESRKYLISKGRNPDHMGPAYALPKGHKDLP